MICKKIAENMGGSIGFTSQKDKGSSFWFDVPLTIKNNISSGEDYLVDSSFHLDSLMPDTSVRFRNRF